ncbi:hypothetical protein CPAR01_09543 [Colletotrichum paranaense]|uniref:Uncharacterized protein n=1 Tax=Colletotrichum paranaense TaxID=1914294 RepID=A0ABQ9SH26_9PEZI|nr:uncharacterized protein CPAR01_09543 [Colletotrichum paranaense]KAK1536001.1 hypothetical protein CPAR01_09543 [Colletotrichum paranaense]
MQSHQKTIAMSRLLPTFLFPERCEWAGFGSNIRLRRRKRHHRSL